MTEETAAIRHDPHCHGHDRPAAMGPGDPVRHTTRDIERGECNYLTAPGAKPLDAALPCMCPWITEDIGRKRGPSKGGHWVTCPAYYRPNVESLLAAARREVAELRGRTFMVSADEASEEIAKQADRARKAEARVAALEADRKHWAELTAEATNRRIAESQRVAALEAERDQWHTEADQQELELRFHERIEALEAALAKATAVLQRMSDHGSCDGWDAPPMGSGGQYKFKGCALFHSDDPKEYCLACDARAALGLPVGKP